MPGTIHISELCDVTPNCTNSRTLSLTARLVGDKKISRPAPGAPIAAHNVRRRCFNAIQFSVRGVE